MSLLERSLAGALLILVIAALRALTRSRLPKRTFVALWWVAAARLLLPFALPSRFSVYTLLAGLRRPAAQVPAAAGAPIQIVPGAAPPAVEGTATQAAAAASLSVWTALWLAGMLLLAAWFAVSYVRSQRRFRESLPVERGFAADWLRGHPRIGVRVSDQIAAPLTYGLLRPVILLPKHMDWEDETALAHILTHEYVHIRYLDNVAKLALAAALCVHWFDPAVWLLYVLANRDIELACDEAVVRLLGQPGAYARTLLRMEETKAGRRPLYSHFSQTAIEERIKAIMKMKLKKTPALALVCALLLVAGVTTVFATSAQADAVPQSESGPLEQLEESIVYMDGRLSFTIPEGGAAWSIWIGGRIVTDGGGMSVHYLEAESAAGSWESGKTYRFALADGPYDSLIMTAAVDGEETDIDLTAWLPGAAAGPQEALSAEAAAQWDEILAAYVPFGLSYRFEDPDHDGNGLTMYYQGREVRGIVDGETWITEHMGNGAYGEDAAELYAVYEDGRLAGLRFATEEEQAQWTQQREQSGAAAPADETAFVWPVQEGGTVSNSFGSRWAPGGQEAVFHSGVDIASAEGSIILAAANGTVSETGFNASDGNYLVLDHGNGLETFYAHCRDIAVQAGDAVQAGEMIGAVGSTGMSTGPHLHFEVRQDGEARDPMGCWPGGTPELP